MYKLYKIPGFKKHSVTKNGEVFTHPCKMHNGKWLKVSKSNSGYFQFNLTYAEGKQRNLGVHRILAITFIPNPENKETVNHKDGNKLNNKIENLEWLTRSENQKHAIKNKLWKVSNKHRDSARKQGLSKRKLSRDNIIEIRNTYNKGVPFTKNKKGLSSRELAIKYNVSKNIILDIVNNRSYKDVI